MTIIKVNNNNNLRHTIMIRIKINNSYNKYYLKGFTLVETCTYESTILLLNKSMFNGVL